MHVCVSLIEKLFRPEQIKKLQDRVQKTKDEVGRLREKYEQSLTEINKYNPVYIEDMSSVFIKCQEMEETRLRFFKSVLFAIHKALNISQNPSLPQIYEEFYHTINNADHQKDLKWWSNNHGVNMAMAWPAFVVSCWGISVKKREKLGFCFLFWIALIDLTFVSFCITNLMIPPHFRVCECILCRVPLFCFVCRHRRRR